jgi:hypothetical protein
MFFVVEGQLLAQRPADDPKQEDVHLTHCAFFGAQCIFKESTRTRNVIALTNGELLEISTSEIYAVGDIYPEVAESLRLRLKEAAESTELCAHCGFAHKLSECPELEHEKEEKPESRKSRPVRSQVSKKMSFRDAVKVVVAGNKSKDPPSNSQRRGVGRSHTSKPEKSLADRLKTRSATAAAGVLLNGSGGNKNAWPTKDVLKSLSITPTPEAKSSPPRDPAPSPASNQTSEIQRNHRTTLVPPQSGPTSSPSDGASPALSEDEECLSPYSPLIKIKLPGQ